MLCTYIYARDSPQFTPLAPGGVNLCILLFISQYAQLREGALWVPLLRSTPLTKIGVLYPRGTPLGVCLGQTFYPHCRLALTCCAQFCERRSAILASGCLSVPRGDPKWESIPPLLPGKSPEGSRKNGRDPCYRETLSGKPKTATWEGAISPRTQTQQGGYPKTASTEPGPGKTRGNPVLDPPKLQEKTK